MKHSITEWSYANSPNYITNVDLKYPYSEVPYIGNYKLIKIPQEGLIAHVDYWGEGRLDAQEGVTGFPGCYNVNHEYQLVSNGPDRNTKIPNRIPVISYTNCNTSSYIENDSVKLVTLMGAPINKSCAKDISRMINAKEGKVIILGFESNSPDVKNLNEELEKRGIYHCPSYEPTDEIKKLTLYDTHRAYLNLTDLGNLISQTVNAGKYENAVALTKIIKASDQSGKLHEIINSMLKDCNKNFMQYAYTLWNDTDGKDLFSNFFPFSIKLILEGKDVKIYDKKYMQALKLDSNWNNKDNAKERKAWGASSDKNIHRIKWQFHATMNNGSLYFKLLNKEYNLYLKSDSNDGDIVLGSSNPVLKDKDYFWSIIPAKVNDDVFFVIVKPSTNLMLLLDDKLDEYHDRLLVLKDNKDFIIAEECSWMVNDVK